MILADIDPGERPCSWSASRSYHDRCSRRRGKNGLSDLIPSDLDRVEAASNEVQFALVIARMIDTVEHTPEHLRRAVFDPARPQERFLSADAPVVKRTRQRCIEWIVAANGTFYSHLDPRSRGYQLR